MAFCEAGVSRASWRSSDLSTPKSQSSQPSRLKTESLGWNPRSTLLPESARRTPTRSRIVRRGRRLFEFFCTCLLRMFFGRRVSSLSRLWFQVWKFGIDRLAVAVFHNVEPQRPQGVNACSRQGGVQRILHSYTVPGSKCRENGRWLRELLGP